MAEITAWYDVSEYLARAEAYSDDVERVMGGNPREFTHRPHVPGKLGECAFGMATGLEVDWTVRDRSDGGQDFPWVEMMGLKLNVRGRWITRKVRAPDLLVMPPKIHPDGHQNWSDLYVLVHLMMVGDRRVQGCVIGWATKLQVQAAPLVDYGHGPSHTVTVGEMIKWDQWGLPPR
jgi:hypothetical protein